MDVQFQMNPLLEIVTNQLEENIIQGRLLLSGPSFRSALVSDIKSLILSGFPLTSLHLAS